MTAAALIREAREASGLTQAELARRLGVTQGAIAQLERPGSNPTVERLDAVLRATGRRLALASVRHTPSIDESLLARNLRLSPEERLAAFEVALGELDELRGLMRDGR